MSLISQVKQLLKKEKEQPQQALYFNIDEIKNKVGYDNFVASDILDKYKSIGYTKEENIANIDMSNAIQIDTEFNNLRNTKAKLKILIKEEEDNTISNRYEAIELLDNLYHVTYLDEILSILEFNLIERL